MRVARHRRPPPLKRSLLSHRTCSCLVCRDESVLAPGVGGGAAAVRVLAVSRDFSGGRCFSSRCGIELNSSVLNKEDANLPMTGKIMFLEKLNWRYATKKMDPSKAVPEEDVAKIVEAVQLAPTSSGLQPYELLVIRNADVRAAIRPVAWDQAQITDGSHLLVFAAWDDYSEARIDAVVDQMAEERGGRSEMLQGYYDRLKAMYLPRSDEENYAHAARQAYIGLGFALAAAAELGVDSTPMEGFDPAQVDEILGLKAKGLRSVLLLPLGYRDETGDWLVNLKKVRKPLGTFVTNID